MKILKQNKGITLIALVITIIVMLILVAVTITIAVNGGLFNYAQKAGQDTNTRKEEEQKYARLKDGLSVDQLIGKYTSIHKWTRDGNTVKCSHCNLEYDLGDEIPYVADEVNTPYTITAQKSGIKRAVDSEDHELSEFDTTIRDSKGNQVIEQEDDLTWVVLGIEDADGDGISESLLITTDDILNCNSDWDNCIYFYGADGAKNAVDELNNLCAKLYSSKTYGTARNMTIEDVNACLNYTPTVNLTTKVKNLSTFDTIVENGAKTPQKPDEDDEDLLGEYVVNGYEYDISELTSENKSLIIFNFRGYWLASAMQYATSIVDFGLFIVSDDGYVSSFNLFNSIGNGEVTSYGFRPVVALRTDIPSDE